MVAGVKPRRVRTVHSGMIGAATKLATGRLPDMEILKAGSWRKYLFVKYARARFGWCGVSVGIFYWTVNLFNITLGRRRWTGGTRHDLGFE